MFSLTRAFLCKQVIFPDLRAAYQLLLTGNGGGGKGGSKRICEVEKWVREVTAQVGFRSVAKSLQHQVFPVSFLSKY